MPAYWARDRSGLVLAAALAVLGFGLVALGFSTASARRADAPRRAELIGLINHRQRQVNDLDTAVRDLRAKVSVAQAAAGRLTTAARDQAALLDRLSLEAGTTAVSGPALVVRLSDSAHVPSDLAQASADRIQDVDLQLVVNALFDAGAEAVGVNGDRLVATTPIRAAGPTIVVNFRPLTPPYEVVAIGASHTRFEASDIARRFHRWTTLFGLGFSVRDAGRAKVAAYSGRVAITTANPVTPRTASTTGPSPTAVSTSTPGRSR